VQTTDLDSMLNESELLKTAFWRRYPTEVHPADTTVLRVSRKLSKRMLRVFNLWKVKTLQFQLTTNQKKRKLGENLCTEEVPGPPLRPHVGLRDCWSRSPSGTTPDATKKAALGADSTEFAAVPLDVCMTYWFEQRGHAIRCTLPRGWYGCRQETKKNGLNGHPDSGRAP